MSLNLTEPSSGYSTVEVTGVGGNGFFGALVYSNLITFPQVSGFLSGTTTTNVTIYNPDNKNFVWATGTSQPNTPGTGDTTMNYIYSVASVPGTAVTLPVPSLTPPSVAVLGTSITYTEGILSFNGSADLIP